MFDVVLFLIVVTVVLFISGWICRWLPDGPFDKWWGIPTVLVVILWAGFVIINTGKYLGVLYIAK